MLHLIFQIGEILRPIAGYVGQVGRPTTVARCCQTFEEPALRPLWPWESTTLENLGYVLPRDVLYFGSPGMCVVGLSSRHSLNRLITNAIITLQRTLRQLTPPERRFDTHLGSDESLGSQPRFFSVSSKSSLGCPRTIHLETSANYMVGSNPPYFISSLSPPLASLLRLRGRG